MYIFLNPWRMGINPPLHKVNQLNGQKTYQSPPMWG